jgi:YVTN family beta-propeller protein
VLVAGFGTDQVESIDTATDQVTWQVAVPQPHNIAITPDGKTAYVASQKQGSEALAILDVASGAETGSVPLASTPRALTVTPDGDELVYTLAGVDALQVLDLATNTRETEIPVGSSPHHPLFTPDGKLGLVVAQGPGSLDLFDPASYTGTGSVKVGDMPHWIAATADSKYAYVTNEHSNTVSVVDLTSGSVATTIDVGNAPRKLVIQPGPATQPRTAQPSTTPPSTAPAPDSAAVAITKFAFSPPTITVAVGQSITWTNTDPIAHTTTSNDMLWDSGPVQPGTTFGTTLMQPGTYEYHCTIHPFMHATVVVQG